MTNPLFDDPPSEVQLSQAPLDRVVFQVRFPPIMAISQPEFIASFQESIRERYPILRRDITLGINVDVGEGLQNQALPQQVAWRFSDETGDWRVTLAPDFVALETTKYGTRADFLHRMELILQSLVHHVKPAHCSRIGLRYIDRVFFASVAELKGLINPQVFGLLGTPMGTAAVQSVSQSLFSLGEGQHLVARTALLAPDMTVDPMTILPSPSPSWVLDLDMFTDVQSRFSTSGILDQGDKFARRIYTFFRWAITDAFLARYRG